MATVTQHAPGTFSWPELAAKNANDAKKFYSALFGWTYDDQDMGEQGVYSMILLKGAPVGAMYTQPKDELANGVPPRWNSYVTVENVDASAAKAKQLGGQLMMEPFDVFDLGRMVAVRDPQGAAFCLWQAKKHIGAHVLGEPGALVWTELMTSDSKAAVSFYTKLFSWNTQEMPAPSGPPYTVVRVGENGTGGIMQMGPEFGGMPPHWYPYFAVDDCDAVAAKAKGMGAQVHVPPTDIPNTGRFAVMSDPQGVHFAIIKTQPM
jgi:uncharacterized protein